MILTMQWLEEKKSCESGILWYKAHNEPQTVESCLALLISQKTDETLGYANWLLSRTLNETNCRRYAIFAARKVLPVFEKLYPDDKRPRQAIEAAEGFLDGTVSAKELAKAATAACVAVSANYWAAKAVDPDTFISILLNGVELLKSQEGEKL